METTNMNHQDSSQIELPVENKLHVEEEDSSGIDYTLYLPEEVLVKIISYLSLEDIKTCRRVSRIWRLCSLRRRIMKNQKFVIYHPPPSMGDEITKFFVEHELQRMNVEFYKTDFQTLNLQSFSHKIEELTIINCVINETKLWNDLLTSTIIMKHFCLVLGRPYKARTDSEKVEKVIARLEEKKFTNDNLRTFKYYGPVQKERYEGKSERFFTIKKLHSIFPKLERIRLPVVDLMDDGVREIIKASNLKELSDCCIDFTTPPFFTEMFAAPLSKLEAVHLRVQINHESYSALKSFSISLTERTELKKLALVIHAHKYSKKNIMKKLLFHMLENSGKLEEFTLKPVDGVNDKRMQRYQILLMNEEIDKFRRLVELTGIKKFHIPTIHFNCRKEYHPEDDWRQKGPKNFCIKGSIEYHPNDHESEDVMYCNCLSSYERQKIRLQKLAASRFNVESPRICRVPVSDSKESKDKPPTNDSEISHIFLSHDPVFQVFHTEAIESSRPKDPSLAQHSRVIEWLNNQEIYGHFI